MPLNVFSVMINNYIMALCFQPIRCLHWRLLLVNTYLPKMNNNPLLQYPSKSCSFDNSSNISIENTLYVTCRHSVIPFKNVDLYCSV